MGRFHGKTIWLIGASTGIGRALAYELSREDATLILSARDTIALQELQALLGARHRIISLDVSDREKVFEAYKEIKKTSTVLDSVIFMAGVYQPSSVSDINIEGARDILDINFMGAMYAVSSVLPDFQARKSGQIVLCASIAGYRGLPNAQPYAASKAALISFAESLRAENTSSGLDIKVINPGFVKTRLTDKNTFFMPMLIQPEEAAKEIMKGLMSNRFEIVFPFAFALIAKIIRILPYWLYFRLVGR